LRAAAAPAGPRDAHRTAPPQAGMRRALQLYRQISGRRFFGRTSSKVRKHLSDRIINLSRRAIIRCSCSPGVVAVGLNRSIVVGDWVDPTH